LKLNREVLEMNLNQEQRNSIINRYNEFAIGNEVWAGELFEDVKAKQLNNFKESLAKVGFPFDDGEIVYFRDFTVFGSGKEGFLVTDQSFYVCGSNSHSIPLNQISQIRFVGREKLTTTGKATVVITDDREFEFSINRINFEIINGITDVLCSEKLSIATNDEKEEMVKEEEVSMLPQNKKDAIVAMYQKHKEHSLLVEFFLFDEIKEKRLTRFNKNFPDYNFNEMNVIALVNKEAFGLGNGGVLITDEAVYFDHGFNKGIINLVEVLDVFPIQRINAMDQIQFTLEHDVRVAFEFHDTNARVVQQIVDILYPIEYENNINITFSPDANADSKQNLSDDLSQLKELQQMLYSQIITQEEFDKMKAKIIDK